jgi:hypothetical protein
MRKIRFSLIFICFAVVSISAQTLLKDGKIPKDLVIKLERTACFGTCPDYQLAVKSNGIITFKGGTFTKTKGLTTGKITSTDLKQIISEFEKTKFFELRNSYSEYSDGCGEVATDSPSEIISIQINGKKKTVSHYFGCRDVKGNVLERIISLGKKIDELTNSRKWM